MRKHVVACADGHNRRAPLQAGLAFYDLYGANEWLRRRGWKGKNKRGQEQFLFTENQIPALLNTQL